MSISPNYPKRTLHIFSMHRRHLIVHIYTFLKIFLEDMSPFCGATDTPVLDFWWCLLWVSKPEWAALFELAEMYLLHVPWESPLVWHLPTFWQPAWQLSRLFHIPARHWWDSKLGGIMLLLTVWDQADALPTELSQLGYLYIYTLLVSIIKKKILIYMCSIPHMWFRFFRLLNIGFCG